MKLVVGFICHTKVEFKLINYKVGHGTYSSMVLETGLSFSVEETREPNEENE